MWHVRAEIAPAILLVVDFGGWYRLDSKASGGNGTSSDMIQHTQVSLLKDVIVPYTHLLPRLSLTENKERNTLLYFKGAKHRHRGGLVREKIWDLVVGERDVIMEEGFPNATGREQSIKGMRGSEFCLHPAGDTPTSCRLFDAIQSLCIPVIVSDNIELPFEGIIDYSEFSVFVAVSDALQPNWLVSHLRSFSIKKKDQFRQRMAQVQPVFVYDNGYPDGIGPVPRNGAVNHIWKKVRQKLPMIREAIVRDKRKPSGVTIPKRCHRHNLIKVEETSYTRLCSTKKILTINGQFPGPTLNDEKGETVRVNIFNKGDYNVTIHWHGVNQPRNPWSDGPEYITQCPIQPRANFSYEVVFSTEEGTLWWHAHSDWSRATVHGPIIVHPKNGTTYPYPKPHAEFPIVLASWYKGDVMEIIKTDLQTGGGPNISDAFTINGQLGDLYNCFKSGTIKFQVEYGKTYLLRLINSIMNDEMFFAIANHTLTLVGMDGAYLKPFETSYVMITPGQTMDILVKVNQTPSHYYIASRVYAGATDYDNISTTAIFEYTGNYSAPSTPSFPDIPDYTDIDSVTNFTAKLRGLSTAAHPIDVPKKVNTRIFIAIAVNTLPCANNSCDGPNGARLAASLNNMSFVHPSIDILLAYYKGINGVFESNFPREPLYKYNYTADEIPDNIVTANPATKVRMIKYNSTVEIVFQGTNILGGENHPMHLHGYSFYVVGSGFGNFNSTTDLKSYNLVNSSELNTFGIPTNGWAAIRFRANNPGVWFMHCHLERHASWGMYAVFIVTNGKTSSTSVRKPPAYLNPC
ncbi:unnamed protein product [Rhodiola kirilowii]